MKRSVALERRTPLARKRARPRRVGLTRCDWAGYACRKEPRVKVSDDERYCRDHATKTADRLVGDFVKDRDHRCCRLLDFNDKVCSTPDVFWCHLVGKGRYPSLRWEPLNAVTGCRDHHAAFDTSPIEKDDWCEKHLGAEAWAELRRRARTEPRPKVADVIRQFRGMSVGS